MTVDIDSESLDLAIAKTKEEIARLEQGLSSLEKAKEFLRAHPNLMPSSNGTKRREHTERDAQQAELRLERPQSAGAYDLSGKTLLEAADVLFDENGNAPLDPDDIAMNALSRGYRSMHPKNKENDPAKLARSVRLMMKRYPKKYEQKEGKYRLKQPGMQE
jgi:hypothetical protein